jgi:hypothetical protein
LSLRAKKEGKKKHRLRFRHLFLLGVLVVASFIVIVGADCRTSFCALVNPPDSENRIPFSLNVQLPNSTEVDIIIAVLLRFNGTLVVGKEVLLNATAYLETPRAQLTIQELRFGIQLELNYPVHIEPNGTADSHDIILQHEAGTNTMIGKTNHYCWPNSGSYAPVLGVTYFNDPTLHVTTFPLSNVYVEPMSQLQVEKHNRVDEALTYALVYFGFMEAYSIYRDIKEKDLATEKGLDERTAKNKGDADKHNVDEKRTPPKDVIKHDIHHESNKQPE